MTENKRYMAIWFRHLLTDRFVRREPELGQIPFVVAAPERGRMIIKAANILAQSIGIDVGMVVADCRAILPDLEVREFEPEQAEKLLTALAEWCMMYTPIVAIDLPEGLILDISGCAHLWGGERLYLKEIVLRLRSYKYDVRASIADTVGTAWAVSRFGEISPIVEPVQQISAISTLPPEALRLDTSVLERMEKLGFQQIKDFIDMPRTAIRRRFGHFTLLRLDQALGLENEVVIPLKPKPVYQERLPSLEPICTAIGIEIAFKTVVRNVVPPFVERRQGFKKGFVYLL